MMKLLSFAALVTLMAATGCTNNVVNPESPSNIAGEDAWRITWYWDQDKDETSDFASYLFYFRDENIVDAVTNSTTATGTWQMRTDDSMQRLVLSFPGKKPLTDLNDDWIVISTSVDQIALRDDNPSHLEEVTFERVQ